MVKGVFSCFDEALVLGMCPLILEWGFLGTHASLPTVVLDPVCISDPPLGIGLFIFSAAVSFHKYPK